FLSTIDGITMTGRVNPVDAEVQVRALTELNGKQLFSVYDPQRQYWNARMGNRVHLDATLDEPTSYVEVDVVGLETKRGAYARIEAFDSNGNLVDRATTDARNMDMGQLAFGQQQTLRLSDPSNTITSI